MFTKSLNLFVVLPLLLVAVHTITSFLHDEIYLILEAGIWLKDLKDLLYKDLLIKFCFTC